MPENHLIRRPPQRGHGATLTLARTEQRDDRVAGVAFKDVDRLEAVAAGVRVECAMSSVSSVSSVMALGGDV